MHSVTECSTREAAVRRVAFAVAKFFGLDPLPSNRANDRRRSGIATRISHFKSMALELRDAQFVIRQNSMLISVGAAFAASY